MKFSYAAFHYCNIKRRRVIGRGQEKDRRTTYAELKMLLPDRVLLLSIIIIIINIIIEYFTELGIDNLIIPNINILNL